MIANFNRLYDAYYKFIENNTLHDKEINLYIATGKNNNTFIAPVIINWSRIGKDEGIYSIECFKDEYKANTIGEILYIFLTISSAIKKVNFRDKETYWAGRGILLDRDFNPLLIACTMIQDISNKKIITPILYVNPKVFTSTSNILKRFIEEIIIPISEYKLEPQHYKNLLEDNKEYVLSEYPCIIQICKIPYVLNTQNSENGLTFKELQIKCKDIIEKHKELIIDDARRIFS